MKKFILSVFASLFMLVPASAQVSPTVVVFKQVSPPNVIYIGSYLSGLDYVDLFLISHGSDEIVIGLDRSGRVVLRKAL